MAYSVLLCSFHSTIKIVLMEDISGIVTFLIIKSLVDSIRGSRLLCSSEIFQYNTCGVNIL